MMSDTDGVLPGSGSLELKNAGLDGGPEAPRLPTAAISRMGEERLPPAAVEATGPSPSVGEKGEPPSRTSQEVPDPAVTQILKPSVLQERLATATLSGGLAELPTGFGDTGGDWVTVRFENPFEVLYLDYRRADRITPEVVSHHRELLQKFWQEKLKSMSQGAARVAIVKKYGGEHESERLVRSYPDLIERAYRRLSTNGGIEDTYREIVTRRQQIVFARIDEKLTDYLVDSVLQTQEIVALLEFADREGVAREVVAARVQDRIQAAGLVSEDGVSGVTLEQQLLSSAWVHPSRKVLTQPSPAPPPRSRTASRAVLAVAVLLALVVGAVLHKRTQTPDSPDKSEPAAPVVEVTPAPPAESTSVPPEPMPPVPDPTPPDSPRAEEPGPQTMAALEDPPEATVDAEERQTVMTDLEEIRTLGTTDPDVALERVKQLDARLAAHSREFADERVALAELRSQIQTAVMERKFQEENRRLQEESDSRAQQERDNKWEQRLAQIEALSRQGNFSGAKTLADELLQEQDLPEPIAVRARKLAEEAVAKLQAIFSGAKVKSKTKRSPDPPH